MFKSNPLSSGVVLSSVPVVVFVLMMRSTAPFCSAPLLANWNDEKSSDCHFPHLMFTIVHWSQRSRKRTLHFRPLKSLDLFAPSLPSPHPLLFILRLIMTAVPFLPCSAWLGRWQAEHNGDGLKWPWASAPEARRYEKAEEPKGIMVIDSFGLMIVGICCFSVSFFILSRQMLTGHDGKWLIGIYLEKGRMFTWTEWLINEIHIYLPDGHHREHCCLVFIN